MFNKPFFDPNVTDHQLVMGVNFAGDQMLPVGQIKERFPSIQEELQAVGHPSVNPASDLSAKHNYVVNLQVSSSRRRR